MERATITFVPVGFTALPRWAEDDHLAAFGAFLTSCRRLDAMASAGSAKLTTQGPHMPVLAALCSRVLPSAANIKDARAARTFFEQNFTPARVQHAGPDGLLTGYYEPVIAGSRTPIKGFETPLYRRPADLMNIVDESQRGAIGTKFTHARKTATGLVPYATRADIDQGALAGQKLELLYVADKVEAFFLQIQGSGQVRLPDGSLVRVTYDGKNGHPYTSVGRYLIDNGIIDAGRMSLQALADWLRSDAKRGATVMQQNKSFVFFRELTGTDPQGPLGVLDIPLTTGRSLAVDTAHHTLGMPIYVSSTALTHATPSGGFHRLMVAQDVGSAIKGPERGDLFFGTGDAAGKLAGITKHSGNFFALLPNAAAIAKTSAGPAAARATGAIPAKTKGQP